MDTAAVECQALSWFYACRCVHVLAIPGTTVVAGIGGSCAVARESEELVLKGHHH
jgi:hypothetical protein